MLIRQDARFYPVVVEVVAALIGLPGVGWLLAERWQLGIAILFGYIILVGWLLGLLIGGVPIIGFPLTRNIVAALISSVALYLYLQRRYYNLGMLIQDAAITKVSKKMQ